MPLVWNLLLSRTNLPKSKIDIKMEGRDIWAYNHVGDIAFLTIKVKKVTKKV